jgi:pimeloyl-ACP methyl ester carboxylesterase
MEIQRKERVILAHGWLGRPSELAALGAALGTAGFDVVNVKLYFLFGRFEAAVNAVRKQVLAEPGRHAHLIGFSLGGLVMRAVADACPGQIDSLLLIGTPNAGSSLADLLGLVFPTSAIRRLSGAAPPLPEPPPSVRVGCIAGTRGGVLGLLLKGRNDSRVTVDSAFDIRHDYEAVIHCKHEVLRDHPDVLRHAVTFLKGDLDKSCVLAR